ncbi:hypothetical protein CCU68_06515 [Pseudomonas gingeri NCPPB 3146 = LMG 5327]|uniref:TrbM protein n=3 Tax=Pseudomonas TaxID=286 RepID=A0A2S1PJM0_9PSED|nr:MULTISPECIES: TrbM/KikA/MpfK family conjugal transfer protein [Pseudomonas]AWH58658.1 Hypothetical protein [Pseudomonas thivervalensis]NWC18711.1 hypothetical protein [Pseudomonas gingeri]PNQ93412.1 hypothetical protein CCU68_06515 [Pseudomonas gingeri NCPPB 3146 = LMG 5327]QXZ17516.1 hypothetical protein KVQ82_31045 [Pseudomonas sp. AO-1]
MRKQLLAFVATLAFAGAAQAGAQPPTDFSYGQNSDEDACGATLCLLGMRHDGDCDKYLKRYFGIRKYKHGDFSPSRTAAARGDFVAQCVDDQAGAKKANDQWGGSFNGF